MNEKIYKTQSGCIHYWINLGQDPEKATLIFLPGLTADHRLFDKQIEFFEGKYNVLYGMHRVMQNPGRLNLIFLCRIKRNGLMIF